MALTREQKFLIDEVFSKVIYDNVKEKYLITVDAYISLNLNTEQLRLLEKMCIENDIVLEKLPQQISHCDTEKFLIDYNNIKRQLEQNISHEERKRLELEKIKVRNIIVEGHMKLVYDIINKCYSDIDKNPDKEDIYQIGYLVLIEIIDKYDVTRGFSFSAYIKAFLYHNVIVQLIRENKKLGRDMHKDLIKLKKVKKLFLEDSDCITKIQDTTGFSLSKIKFLEVLLRNTEDISLEELIEAEEPLEEDMEEILIEKIIKENLVMLLDFLTPIEREIIKLYYGFYNNKEYTLDEISRIMGTVTHERVRQIKKDAIEKLRLPIYSIHIDRADSSNEMLEEYLKMKKDFAVNSKISQYEILLLSSLPKETLNDLMSDLSDDVKKIMSLYLGLDGERYNILQISSKVNMSHIRTKRIVISAMHSIKMKINNKTNKGYRYGEYYKYLTQDYFKRKIKR